MLTWDQQKLVGCLLASIPLSYFMNYINKPSILLMFTCICSVILQSIVFEYQILLLWFQQSVVYLLCKFGPRKNLGKTVLFETFLLLVFIQLARMYLSYGVQSIDITAIFMMQVFQYISFAYNYQDGCAEQQVKTKYTINSLPSYKQYLGYVLFIPSCLVGPVFEFADFQNYLNKTGAFSELTPRLSKLAMCQQLKTTLFSMAIFALLISFPLEFMLTAEYADMNMLMQAGYMMVSIVGCRFKYYTAWSIGMVAMHATGFTYNPKELPNGQISNKWDRVVVSNIWDFQMDPSMKKKADGWNIPIQIALKRYVYDKIYKPDENHTPRQKKRLQIQAQQKTLAVSALWHGLYPGYFIAFFHWALILQISQQLFRIQKESQKLKKIRHKFRYVQLILINYFLGYFGVCFKFMTWQRISIFFSASYFIPIIIVYVSNILIVRLALFSKKALKAKPKPETVKSDSRIQTDDEEKQP